MEAHQWPDSITGFAWSEEVLAGGRLVPGKIPSRPKPTPGKSWRRCDCPSICALGQSSRSGGFCDLRTEVVVLEVTRIEIARSLPASMKTFIRRAAKGLFRRALSVRPPRTGEGFLSEFLSVFVSGNFVSPRDGCKSLSYKDFNWSEWSDSNTRPPRPERGALPDCATLRDQWRLL
jgi:hypothetical protein